MNELDKTLENLTKQLIYKEEGATLVEAMIDAQRIIKIIDYAVPATFDRRLAVATTLLSLINSKNEN